MIAPRHDRRPCWWRAFFLPWGWVLFEEWEWVAEGVAVARLHDAGGDFGDPFHAVCTVTRQGTRAHVRGFLSRVPVTPALIRAFVARGRAEGVTELTWERIDGRRVTRPVAPEEPPPCP